MLLATSLITLIILIIITNFNNCISLTYKKNILLFIVVSAALVLILMQIKNPVTNQGSTQNYNHFLYKNRG